MHNSECIILTDKLLCAILRPRLKAITALCIITAMKMASISLLSVCRPIASPFKFTNQAIFWTKASHLKNRVEGECDEEKD